MILRQAICNTQNRTPKIAAGRARPTGLGSRPPMGQIGSILSQIYFRILGQKNVGNCLGLKLLWRKTKPHPAHQLGQMRFLLKEV